ncbi:SDR family NAD(P)-dependent oxidoreductase [Anaerolineales bacterium]
MAGEYDSKVVIVTGAAGGLGSIVSRRFAAEGAKLALWDIHEDRLKVLADSIGKSDTLIHSIDLTSAREVEAALQKVIAQHGRVDVLLHIAGGFAMPGPVHEGHLDSWEKMMALNATATYIVCGKVAGLMVQKHIQGAIVAVSAKPGLKANKNMVGYSASKSAVMRIVEGMAEELKEHRIRINCILPSVIDTPANRRDMGEENAEKWVKPEEIADIMLFLAGERASAITGAKLEVFKWV